jgi:diguanylate cyclase (GGDEF)-like protein
MVIIPVIVLSYFSVLVVVYLFERSAYLDYENSRLALHLNQLKSSVAQYTTFVEPYFSAFVKSPILRDILTAKDARFSAYSIEGNLETAIDKLKNIEFNSLSLIVVDANEDIKYFYDNGDDPFSEPNENMLMTAKIMLSERKEHQKIIKVEDGKTIYLQADVINPLTQTPPISGDWDNAVAVVAQLDMKLVDRLKTEFKNEMGYVISQKKDDDFSEENHNRFGVHITSALTPQQFIHIESSQSEITKKLLELLFKQIIAWLIFTVASSFFLITLISRYITKPIRILEKQIIAAGEKGADFPEPIDANDEISSLKKSFFNLYSQLRQSYEKTKILAETDGLTKLKNRRIFTEIVGKLISRADKAGKFAILYIDLDNFKFVNDNFGHEAGDILLKEFSDKLRSAVRPTDVVMTKDYGVARIGGDEFSVILNSFDSDSDVIKVSNRIISIFEGGFICSAGCFPVSASIGIAMYPNDGDSAKELIGNADKAMYQAKKGGKNNYSFFSSRLACEAIRELAIEAVLKAKDYSEFVVYYMPVVDAKTTEIVGVEALVRWFSSDLGFVSPVEFIPLAESRGHIKDLDLWIVNCVFDDLPKLHSVIGNDAKVAINISSAQLGSDDIFLKLMQLLQSKNTTSTNIEFEITETFSAVMSDQVRANLNLFKQAGFSLALDDFGAGHTSLVQLFDYPLDVIKIDKSIVDKILDDGKELVVALIVFCKEQGYKVTAEGVETQEQADVLRNAGADYLQGFYFAKPQPLNELTNFIEKQ